jgi:hypothetical protein
MQLSQESRDAHRAIECSETFETRCNAIRKDVQEYLTKIVPQYFTPSNSSGFTKAEFVERFISGLSLDVAFDEVQADKDLVNSILLQDD